SGRQPIFFISSSRRRTRFARDWSSDVCSSDLQASEVVVTEGDVDWYVTPLADGRWAAWDDAEIALDRVAHFGTREEAIRYHRDRSEERRVGKDSSSRWSACD